MLFGNPVIMRGVQIFQTDLHTAALRWSGGAAPFFAGEAKSRQDLDVPGSLDPPDPPFHHSVENGLFLQKMN